MFVCVRMCILCMYTMFKAEIMQKEYFVEKILTDAVCLQKENVNMRPRRPWKWGHNSWINIRLFVSVCICIR